MGFLCSPSSYLLESSKVNRFELLLFFRTVIDPMVCHGETTGAILACCWRGRAFGRCGGGGGWHWGVVLREPTTLRRVVGWRVVMGGGGGRGVSLRGRLFCVCGGGGGWAEGVGRGRGRFFVGLGAGDGQVFLKGDADEAGVSFFVAVIKGVFAFRNWGL